MKIKIYGCTGSFPRTMTGEEIAQKIYNYQKTLNANGGYENYLRKLGLESKVDNEGNLSEEEFSNFLTNRSNFDFWIGNTYGGNTPCVYIQTADNKHIALDAGAGFLRLSKDLMKLQSFKDSEDEVFIFLSHFHWDHIQAVPFSALIFTQNKMKFIGMPVIGNENVQTIVEKQMNKYNFPIKLDHVNKNITFFEIAGPSQIGEQTIIKPYKMEHPLIGSYTYKITDTKTNKSIVYMTDFEQPPDKLEDKLIEICKDANTLIIDAHFTPGESTNYQGWGHGNFGNAIDLARLAGIKNLILFHHNFNKTDKELFKTETDVLGYLDVSKSSFEGFDLNVYLAREGLELTI